MTELKTDYKEDILETSQQGKRTFNIVSKTGEILFEDVHIEDVSKYTQVGDEYGQETINTQNEAINALMKGAYVRYETYAEYETAYENGEVAEGSLVIIDELTNDNITALQVGYNNSNVKSALDVHGNSISQINSDLSANTQLVLTPSEYIDTSYSSCFLVGNKLMVEIYLNIKSIINAYSEVVAFTLPIPSGYTMRATGYYAIGFQDKADCVWSKAFTEGQNIIISITTKSAPANVGDWIIGCFNVPLAII